MESSVSLAVDIGGTFTDVVVRRGDRLFVEKTLTTHDDLLRGFMEGVSAALRKADARPQDVTGGIFHATTVVTNALIERKGARTAMVFTQGFCDILEIREGNDIARLQTIFISRKMTGESRAPAADRKTPSHIHHSKKFGVAIQVQPYAALSSLQSVLVLVPKPVVRHKKH